MTEGTLINAAMVDAAAKKLWEQRRPVVWSDVEWNELPETEPVGESVKQFSRRWAREILEAAFNAGQEAKQ